VALGRPARLYDYRDDTKLEEEEEIQIWRQNNIKGKDWKDEAVMTYYMSSNSPLLRAMSTTNRW